MNPKPIDLFLCTLTLAFSGPALLSSLWLETGSVTLGAINIGLFTANLYLLADVYREQRAAHRQRMETWKKSNPRLTEMVAAHVAGRRADPGKAGPLINEMARAAVLLKMDTGTVANLAAQYFRSYDQRLVGGMSMHACQTCYGGYRGLPVSLCPTGLRTFLKHASPVDNCPKNEK